ncbi:MAG: PIN domain nuclease [Candidatus Parabeggiatoa sp. nov. 3]|nr:MAG: PIN domain nuclease [Gammaproteobacteria bacterium]RKZ65059.1 MAG: PIN domain nuclease [Gammaproteobacteria bacterium]RKZ88787.1 MAG: PIN domain nuclease [Gammaproteobacteria bacterium]
MTLYVVDACVAIKWFVLEIHNKAALGLLNSAYHLHVPNFFLLEFGNVIGKKYRRGEITLAESHFMINKLQEASLTWHEDNQLFPKAFEIAFQNRVGKSRYTSSKLYLASS